jgi:hypothetical protein
VLAKVLGREIHNSEFFGNDKVTGTKHEKPSADDGGVAREDKEHEIFFPERPVQWISRTITGLRNKNDIFVLSLSVP